MSYQLVVSGNRILAHGTDCFYSMGGTVICPETERVYQNATVVNCEKIPSDIDLVGYEYHSGEFVPCAPFGVGNGNVAVVCGNDCKAIKDSGIPLEKIQQRVLLWENASPSSDFGAQTITLASAAYEYLLIESAEATMIIPKGGTYDLSQFELTTSGSDDCINFCTRNFAAVKSTPDQINVGKSKYYRIKESGWYEFDSNMLVPLKIYGIKGGALI